MWRQLQKTHSSTILDLEGFYPCSGKAKTNQNHTLGLPVPSLGNSATSPTEQQEKSHSFPQRFYHLRLGTGEASPPSCEQASAFCWLFLCNQNKFLGDESHGFKGVQRDVKQASSVNQWYTLPIGLTVPGWPISPVDSRQGKGPDGCHEPHAYTNTHTRTCVALPEAERCWCLYLHCKGRGGFRVELECFPAAAL